MPASESGSYLLQTSPNEKAFGFLQQLMRLGCAWTPLEQNQHLYFAERKALFYSGSMEDIIRQQKTGMRDDWELIPYPSLEGNEIILSDGLSYGILHSDAEHDLASWLFIRWLQEPENLARVIALTSTLPPVPSVREEVSKIAKLNPAWELSLQYLPLVKSMPLLASWLDVGKVLQDAAWQVVQSNIKPGDMIIATGAVRGEHTSEELISMEYPAVADYRVVRALIDACEKLGLPYHLGIVRTHDAFYLESPWALGDFRKRLQPWVDLGVLALENESSTLFTICSMHGVRGGTILAGGYSILEDHDEKIHQEDNIRKMVMAGIEAAKLLHERGLA